MSVFVDKASSLIRVCIMHRTFAADHSGKLILVNWGLFSWLVFNTIWVPPDEPSTVSWSSSKTTGRELTKSGISRGRLPLGVLSGSRSFCAGSANSSDIPNRIGSPSESSKALSSSCTAVSVCNVAREGMVGPCAAVWPDFCAFTCTRFGASILDRVTRVMSDWSRAISILARVSSSSSSKFSFVWRLLTVGGCFSASGVMDSRRDFTWSISSLIARVVRSCCTGIVGLLAEDTPAFSAVWSNSKWKSCNLEGGFLSLELLQF